MVNVSKRPVALARHWNDPLPCIMKRCRPAVVLLLASVTLPPPMQAESPQMQGSAVWAWDSLEPFPTGVGERRDVVDLPTAMLEGLECHISTLNPGNESHPQHKHAREEFIILKEGTLDVIINGVAHRVGPGSLFFFAANDFHSVNNVGDVPATYLVFNVQTAATHTAPEAGAAQTAAPGTLASQVYEWNDLAVQPTKQGERRVVFDAPTVTLRQLECHITTLHAGLTPHAGHRHPDEEIIVVKDGTVEATINGAAQTAGPGSIIFFASNDEHALRNVGDSDATYYVFRFVSEATPTA